MSLDDDEHLDVCQNMKVGLKHQYELHPDLTDSVCIFALGSAKIAVRKQFGFARNQTVPTHPARGRYRGPLHSRRDGTHWKS